MPPRSDGGRAYKKGGAVKQKMSGDKKHSKKPFKMRADGGQTVPERTSQVNREAKGDMPEKTGYGNQGSNRYGGADLPVGQGPNEKAFYKARRWAGGAVSDSSKGGTKVQHSGNKSDAQNIGRGPVITRATGGPIYANGAKGKQMAWLKGKGAGGGKGRLAKAAREGGHEPWLKDAAS